MIDKSEQINELAAALSKAQALIQPASKDAENLGFKNAKTGKASKYADLAAVWEACRAPLAANGLSVVQLPADAESGRVALTSILLHASGQYISSTVSMRLMQDTPHGAGSALTYLRRYALAALVGVVADEDDDGNAASNHHTNGSASYDARPQQQPAVRPQVAQIAAQQAAAGGTPLCPVHNRPMREGKNGGYFCATKLDDGSWCKARPEKPAPATRTIPDEWDSEYAAVDAP